MNLKVGQRLWYINKFTGETEFVRVVSVEPYCFCISWNGKVYERSYSTIYDVFFFTAIGAEQHRKKNTAKPNAFNKNPAPLYYDYDDDYVSPSYSGKPSYVDGERQSADICDSCMECTCFLDQSCHGSMEACSDYLPRDWQPDWIEYIDYPDYT